MHKPISEKDKKTFVRLYLEKKVSMRDIARQFHIGETAVHKWLHRLNVPIRTRSEAMKGIVKSEEHRRKISEDHKTRFLGAGNPNWKRGEKIKGKLNPNWKNGISGWQSMVRGSADYRRWRKAVFERDNYTCRSCNHRGGYLQADHIKPFAFYPELRLKVSNGRTLCLKCHRKTFFGTKHRYYLMKNEVNSVEVQERTIPS